VSKAVLYCTKGWAAIKKKRERDQLQADRMEEQLSRGRRASMTVKEAAETVIPEAYAKASGSIRTVKGRQVMYAARPMILKMTGKSSFDDDYFTQILLPDYQKRHPEETANWDIVYDARGHLLEPHTEYEFGIGTLGVRNYLASMDDRPADQKLEVPDLPRGFPTRGPHNRFGAVLYIEKEGFLELLKQAQFGERYDMAICSSKGMGSTSVRELLENLPPDVKVLALHDFDKSGFSIVGTLTRDTLRYTHTTVPKIFDLGLRLTDVHKWELLSEEVSYDTDPSQNLERNGATTEEIAFLRGEHQDGGKYRGQRVELNAFTNNQFVQWLDEKLAEHGVVKVIPKDATLRQAYQRAAGRRKYEEILQAAKSEVDAHGKGVVIPDNLGRSVAEYFDRYPSASWDDAIESLVSQGKS
jgi:hypothetical protein